MSDCLSPFFFSLIYVGGNWAVSRSLHVRFLFASRHEQKHRILWIRSKNDLPFFLKKCKILGIEKWKDRARKVQPWYGLGTALVRSHINNIFFHLCEKLYFGIELINIQLLNKKLSTFVNYNEMQNKCNLFVINFIIRVKCFSFKRLYFYTFPRVKYVIRNCLSCFWIKSMHK